MSTINHRIHEETAGIAHHGRIGQFAATDVNDGVAHTRQAKCFTAFVEFLLNGAVAKVISRYFAQRKRYGSHNEVIHARFFEQTVAVSIAAFGNGIEQFFARSIHDLDRLD